MPGFQTVLSVPRRWSPLTQSAGDLASTTGRAASHAVNQQIMKRSCDSLPKLHGRTSAEHPTRRIMLVQLPPDKLLGWARQCQMTWRSSKTAGLFGWTDRSWTSRGKLWGCDLGASRVRADAHTWGGSRDVVGLSDSQIKQPEHRYDYQEHPEPTVVRSSHTVHL